MTTIGFIGVGNMGGPMARNLGKAGNVVRAHDANPETLRKLQAEGVEQTRSIAEACGGAEVLMTMLPTGKEVREVYMGEGGIFDNTAPGTLLIDCSTIDVETARAVAAEAVRRGFRMIDAPVSGGVGGATAGTLTMMCGGEAVDVEAARPYLETVGRKVVHCGPSGNGQAVKICNNMVAGICMIANSEAFALGEKLGIDHQTLWDVLSTSSASNFGLLHMCPVPGPVPGVPAERDYQPGFAAALMWKDLRLAQSAARSTGAATPIGAAAEALYALFNLQGKGHLDTTAIIKLIRGEI